MDIEDKVRLDCFNRGYEQGKKETVEKFAERLKEKFAYDIERCKAVDEILNEIKEGKL